MSQIFTNKSRKVGLPPGSLIHVGEKKTDEVRITLFDYDQGHYEEKEIESLDQALQYRDQSSVTWINVDGLHDVDLLQEIGTHFKIHPLVLEDILNTGQRPKVEDHEHYMFIVVKMLTCKESSSTFIKENMSIVFGSKFVISFQEREGDVLEVIRQRIRNQESRIRRSGTDYLVYRLLDTIVDHYFLVLENYGERIESLEIEVTGQPASETAQAIHILKRELLLLRKPIWPLREVLSGLLKVDESSLVQDSTRIFLRDVHDHVIQLCDSIDNFRELASGLLDIYLSAMSNRMNEVMKVLTVIATIFIPLTFIAGIYGMNFKFMPELEWRFGYALVWLLILAVGGVMLLFFRRKKWLS